MNDGMVEKQVKAIKDDLTNVHDEERRRQPSIITNELVGEVDEKVRETDALRFHRLMSLLQCQYV